MQDVLDSFRPNLFKDKHILVTGGSSGIGLAIGQGLRGSVEP
jgi:NADP-dependent 3-hydroxy acid dehydrogenase YdfG